MKKNRLITALVILSLGTGLVAPDVTAHAMRVRAPLTILRWHFKHHPKNTKKKHHAPKRHAKARRHVKHGKRH